MRQCRRGRVVLHLFAAISIAAILLSSVEHSNANTAAQGDRASPGSSPVGHQSASFASRTAIGALGSVDRIAELHVRALLASHGIPVRFAGSVGIGIYVPADRAAEARSLVERDARKYRFWLYSEGKIIDPSKVKPQWSTVTVSLSRAALAKHRKDLPFVLRAALPKRWFGKALRQYGVVRSVRWRTRSYLDIVVTDKKNWSIPEKRGFVVVEKSVYYVTVVLAKRDYGRAAIDLSYQVLSDGAARFPHRAEGNVSMESVGRIVTYTYDLPPRRKAEKPAGAATTVAYDSAAGPRVIRPELAWITTYVYGSDDTVREKRKG